MVEEAMQKHEQVIICSSQKLYRVYLKKPPNPTKKIYSSSSGLNGCYAWAFAHEQVSAGAQTLMATSKKRYSDTAIQGTGTGTGTGTVHKLCKLLHIIVLKYHVRHVRQYFPGGGGDYLKNLKCI